MATIKEAEKTSAASGGNVRTKRERERQTEREEGNVWVRERTTEREGNVKGTDREKNLKGGEDGGKGKRCRGKTESVIGH